MQRDQPHKSHFVHKLFERIASNYDFMNSFLSFGLHKAWRKRVMREMHVQKGDTAVDVCCGTCEWTISLAKASQRGRVVGIDFSDSMLEYGKKKIEESALKSVDLIKGDAMRLPFDDDVFDHATIGFALRNVENMERVLKEMRRVVKPGGQIVSLDLSKPTFYPFRMLYYLYFKWILPFLGYLFAKSYKEYKWLPDSLLSFPNHEELKKIMEEIELEGVRAIPLTGGVVAIHIGRKGMVI